MKPIRLPESAIFHGCSHIDHKQPFIWQARGFASIEEHAERIISDIATYARDHPDAVLVYLGDGFLNSTPDRALTWFRRMALPVFYIWGNHEGPTRQLYSAEIARLGIERPEVYPLYIERVCFVGPQATLKVGDQLIYAHHFPAAVWDKSHHGTWHVHSHCHGSFADSLPEYLDAKRLDVGVDVCLKTFGRVLVTAHELKAIMDRKTVHAVDHHNRETT